MAATVLRLGSRGSALALTQAELVRDRLVALGAEVEIVRIRVSGDERGGVAAPPSDDKSRFVKEIEEALLADRIDLAVHSAKDVPGGLPDGLAIVGVPQRADARDALCGAFASVEALPEGAAVGTASLRRRAQLLAARPDLEVRELRGNVDTRLRRLVEGELDAIVLATAGLDRLGRPEGAAVPEATMTPAPGQGCLALEARSGDARVRELAGALTDPTALVELTAERALVTRLEATCQTPVGAHARLRGDGTLTLDAFAGMPDGSVWLRDTLAGDPDDPAALGGAVGQRLLAAGARDLLDAAEAVSGRP